MKRVTAKTFPGIGEVRFRRNPRAKYLNIRVKLFEGVQVTVPGRMSLARAQDWVRLKETWIKKCLAKNQQTRNALQVSVDEPIETKYHTVLIKRNSGKSITLRFQGRTAHLTYPEEVEWSDARLQRGIRSALVEVYRKEAKQILPSRVRLLAIKFGFTYARVFIKNLRSRWGSCSARNNINLNLHLMRLSDDLIDYVILHELVHTEIRDHSTRFWARLAEVCPNTESLRQELRQVEGDLLPR